jgi:hypothetical protein
MREDELLRCKIAESRPAGRPPAAVWARLRLPAFADAVDEPQQVKWAERLG